jgi:TolB-like protein/class 3 adenylate cyclase/predicted Zn-dependent protease
MAEEGFKRKLTAILSADVIGYSRLMRDDEEATVRDLAAHRVLITEIIQQHHGRVIDSPGDNILAEFVSVVDAVNGAVKIQEEIKKSNTGIPQDRRMEFRIGINLGDVIEEEERIYGDGVNIAARIEGLAEGGGIAISGTVYEHIKDKLSLGYHYLGEQDVKNIPEPVRVYRLLTEPEDAGKMVGEEKPKAGKWRLAAFSALALIILVAGALVIWNYHFRVQIEPASLNKMAFPLPKKPSIVVLPFDNLSDNSEQDYIADGITDNIITALSYIPQMFVIDRNSSFTYKRKPVKVPQVSEELGVRYILEGSVLKSGNKVRITAQLIDALRGGHMWSERYDRDIEDIFDLLDEITLAITVALQVKLTDGEQARILYGSTRNFVAWGYAVKGLGIFYSYTKEAMIKSRELFEKAIELDPNYAHAATMLAWTHFIDTRLGHTDSQAASLDRAVELAKKALSMDDNDPLVHSLWQHIYLIKKQHVKAVEEGRKAIALGPNIAEVHILFGETLLNSGMFEEAVRMCEKAIRLHPHPPVYYLGQLMNAYYWIERYDDSLAIAEQFINRSRKVGYRSGVAWGYLGSALVHIRLGQESEAREEIEQVLQIWSKYNLDITRNYSVWALQKDPNNLQQVLDALRKAGVPEHAPLPLPDKPSIAVLAFDNMSGDSEQEYFSDGLSEEIITALSKTPKLFVIARNSSFTYKGKPVKVQQIGRELGVKYVLEGSVRKSGDRVRITAQLVDAKAGNHLWAERYDRDLKDIFSIQDDITKQIIAALHVKLTIGEDARLLERGTNSFEAYLKYLQAREHHYRFTKEDNLIGRRLAEEVISIDPEYAAPYSLIGATHMMEVWFQTSDSPKQSMGKAIELTRKAIDLGEDVAHALLGFLYLQTRQYDQAIAECQKSVDLVSNSATARTFYGLVLKNTGRFKEAVQELEHGLRLDPFSSSFSLRALADAYSFMGRYEEAIATGKKATQKSRNDILSHIILARAYSAAGRTEEAKTAAAEVLRINPKFSLELFGKQLSNKNQTDNDRFIDDLRRAGLK